MNFNLMTHVELQIYLTEKLPEKFDDSAILTLAYPLSYDADYSTIEVLKEQVKGYESLYLYLKEKDDFFIPVDFHGFPLNAHLAQSLECKCPSAYCLLIAEAVRKITPTTCEFDTKQIEACFVLIDQSIHLFGALGHYFGLRLSLQLGHHYFSQMRSNQSFYASSETNKKNSEVYYKICATHFEKFLPLIKEKNHQAIFKNAFMGKEIKDVFHQETRCQVNSFSQYLLRYYLKVSENAELTALKPSAW